MTDYTNSEMKTAIDECIHSERDREIMKRRYIDGVIYDRLAEEFGLSVRRVKAITYHGESRVFKYIDAHRKDAR